MPVILTRERRRERTGAPSWRNDGAPISSLALALAELDLAVLKLAELPALHTLARTGTHLRLRHDETPIVVVRLSRERRGRVSLGDQ
jgi:hypothetical protein